MSSTTSNGERSRDELLKEYERLKDLRAQGRYVPPARLRALEEKLNLEQSSEQKQRQEWDNLKKSINSLINKVNQKNIKLIVQQLFKCNLVRGRGLFCRSIMKAQALALPFTPVYASLVAIINSKLPMIGFLLLERLILQFRKAFRRNNKPLCLSTTIFIAHLCNQRVAHEILALQILQLLLEKPTDDSVEIAVEFMKECGAYLSENSKAATTGVFDRLLELVHDGSIDKRTEYLVENLFKIRKENFEGHPAIPEELDLVEEEEQTRHVISFDDKDIKAQDILNVFKFDENYEANEEKYNEIKHDILGDSDEDEEENDSEDDSSASESEDEEPQADPSKPVIKDMTNVELTNLRKTIYLTIMSSMSVDEAAHKLLRLQVPDGNEIEIVNMIVETCAQEKIYNKTYGGVANRFCYKAVFWRNKFAESFKHYYEVIHRYDTNQIRNIATLFGYILATDALDWSVFEVVHMNEEETTSSSRIFIKLLFQEMKQEMGEKAMIERFNEEYLQPFLVNMFPMGDDPDAVRFSINYFTAIGLGVLTEKMREYLDNMPEPESSEEQSEEELNESDEERELSDTETKPKFKKEDSSRSRSSSVASRSYSPPLRRRRRESDASVSDRESSDEERNKPRRRRRDSSSSDSSSRGRRPPREHSFSPIRTSKREYSPPPKRPRNWDEVPSKTSSTESRIKKEEAVGKKESSRHRAKASDYL